ncbi:MAG: hypothetical protein LUE23_04345 [Lachnospiraceae bacterium]|nr:hypothetical protein [Lachnospiraceae bacterium]
MSKILFSAVYICIGRLMGWIIGYGGLIETLTWPLIVPLAVWLRGKEDDEE